MISIKIDGIEYNNVSSVSPTVKYDFYHNVKTMDGKIHRSTKGKRTNFTVLFFNKNFEEYDKLKKMLMSKEIVALEVPDSFSGTISGDYFITVSKDQLSGKLWVGGYYNTSLTVSFERVGYDE